MTAGKERSPAPQLVDIDRLVDIMNGAKLTRSSRARIKTSTTFRASTPLLRNRTSRGHLLS